MAYASTISEYQRVTYWWLLIEEFGPNFNDITVINNMIDGILSRLPPETRNQEELSTRKVQSSIYDLLFTRQDNNHKIF